MESSWLTWGLDNAGGDVVVKVWSQQTEDNKDTSYRLLGTIAQPHLACARVCPAPAEPSFVTVSFEETAAQTHWNAAMWKVTAHGLERALSFQGGDELDHKQVETALGTLFAAELVIQQHKEDAGLVLCTLTDKGFLASYVSDAVQMNIFFINGGLDCRTM